MSGSHRFRLPPLLHSWFALWLPCLGVAALPVFSTWLQNDYEVTGQDLVLPLLLSSLAATLVTALFFRRFRRQDLAASIAAIFTTLLISHQYESRLGNFYGLFKALDPLPDLPNFDGFLMSGLFFVVIIVFIYWLSKLLVTAVQRSRWRALDLRGGLIVIIAVTFSLQFFATVTTLVTEWPQFFYRPPQLPGTSTTTAAGKPDIYYIVLDRYTSQSILQQDFLYDNSSFTQFLQSQQFSVNPNAKDNYPYTTMSIAATLNANYATDAVRKFSQASEQTLEPYHRSIQYGAVIQRLKALGYSYYQLGSWYEATNQTPLADHAYQPEGQLTVFGHTYTLNGFAKNELKQSIFWRFVQEGYTWGKHTLLGYSGISDADATLYKVNALKQLADTPTGGRLIFAHILVPHDPYYFNADGSLNPNSDSNNVGETLQAKYTNQVTFINNEMKEVITKITTGSKGQAVIILQSDEGPYPMQLLDNNYNSDSVGEELSNNSMLNWSDQELQMKYGILAAYHIPQATTEDLAAGGDSINIFRVVLNRYFGSNLPYLPRCYYAYPDGRNESFVYKDITARLTGTANSACSSDSNFK